MTPEQLQIVNAKKVEDYVKMATSMNAEIICCIANTESQTLFFSGVHPEALKRMLFEALNQMQ